MTSLRAAAVLGGFSLCVALGLQALRLRERPHAEPPSPSAGRAAPSSDDTLLRALEQPRCGIVELAGPLPSDARCSAEPQKDPWAGAAHLRVAVVDGEGAPVRTGLLDVEWTRHPHVEQATSRRGQRYAIAGDVTEVRVPADANGILIHARSTGLPPGRVHVYDARRQDGDWFDPDREVRWDVRIVLAEPAGRVLEGRVLVDGVPRIPDGLGVRLEQEIGAVPDGVQTIEEYLDLGPQLAELDADRATYRVWPVQDAARGLWVVSEETAPLWVPLDPEDLGAHTTLDLRLATGGELLLTVLDAVDRRPCARLPLEVERSAVRERGHGTVSLRSETRSLATDEQGRLVVTGLPPDGALRVTWLGETRSVELLNLRVEGAGEPRMERTVLLDPEPATASLWGRLPADLVGHQPAPTVTATRDGSSGDPFVAELAGSRWSLRVPAGGYLLRVGLQGSWAEEAVHVSVAPGEEVGPVELAWSPPPEITVHVRSVPVGTRIVVRALHEDGGRLELARTKAELEDWTFTVPDTGAPELGVSLFPQGGDATRTLTLPVDSSRVVEVDLQDQPVLSFEPTRNGQLLEGPLSVSLIRVDPPGETVLLDATAGWLEGRVSPGCYVYVIRPAGETCSLWGTVHVDGVAPVVPLEWLGEPVSRQDLCAGAGSLVIESLFGWRLDGAVPTDFRRMPLTGDLVWVPDDWTYHCD